MKDIASKIFYSNAKVHLNAPCPTIMEALNFGFSYIESEDHVVEYVVANPVMMKKIFTDISDSKVMIDDHAIGELWTSKLLLNEKLRDNQIVFSNKTFSVVINLNLNKKEDDYGDL